MQSAAFFKTNRSSILPSLKYDEQKAVISKEGGQEAWYARINLLSQSVSVIGEDYVKQLNDGGIVDTKIEASQVNMNMQSTDLNARVNALEGDAPSKAFRLQIVEAELQAIKLSVQALNATSAGTSWGGGHDKPILDNKVMSMLAIIPTDKTRFRSWDDRSCRGDVCIHGLFNE